jgi:hypothetical protein
MAYCNSFRGLNVDPHVLYSCRELVDDPLVIGELANAPHDFQHLVDDNPVDDDALAKSNFERLHISVLTHFCIKSIFCHRKIRIC